jgi:hypothetical protein
MALDRIVTYANLETEHEGNNFTLIQASENFLRFPKLKGLAIVIAHCCFMGGGGE